MKRYFVLSVLILLAVHQPFSFAEEPKPIKYSFIVGPYLTPTVVKAIKNIWAQYPFLRERIDFELVSKTDLDMNFDPHEIEDSGIVVIDIMGIRISTSTQAGFDREVIKKAIANGARILPVSQSGGLDKEYLELGLTYDEEFRSYFEYDGVENFQNMVLFSLYKYQKIPEIKVELPKKRFKNGYFHRHNLQGMFFESFEEYKRWYEEAGYLKKGAEWVAVLTYSAFCERDQNEAEDELVHLLEEKGFNAFIAFGYPEAAVVEKLMSDMKGGAKVSGILSFLFRFSDFKATEVLGRCGVPIINLITLYGKDGKEWESDPEGLSSLEVSWQLAIPEIAGLIQPTVAAYRIRERDDETGFFVENRRPIHERINRAVNRMKTWISLQKKNNKDKKVAILYWNYPPGKQHIGASYLNAFASIDNILKKMDDEGYDVGSESIDAETLLENALKYGRNIGSWAPGELNDMVKNKKCVLLPLETYQKWCRNLPANFIKNINKDWGPVEESDVMIWTDPSQKKKYMVIPALKQGNAVILPQPVRGWLQNTEAMYHSKDLSIHHQYLGAYLWLKYGFDADAVIHLGTHGTHEWLPGKSGGLSGDDTPEALIQDLPVIYPFIVDDVGEGLVAKRRGSAVVIDHMIPPLKKGGLYHEYAELEELISDHNLALGQGAEHAKQYMENIMQKIKSLGLDKDIEIDKPAMDSVQTASTASTSSFSQEGETGEASKSSGSRKFSQEEAVISKDGSTCNLPGYEHEVIHKIEGYLRELKQLNMPYGLHTFGAAPDASLRLSTIQAIQEVAKDISADELDKNIREGAKRELSNLIKAMNGQYISTGTGNDPVRNPDSLPTGKNFYAFNPDKIPKKEAWQVGVKLTKELLDDYRKDNNGKYPEKLSFVIWGTETIRHEGVLESQVLYLLGVEPVWNEWGRITGIKIIPQEELGRPRIDIVVSSAAEEMFGQLTQYIDQAVQMVKSLDEKDNYVRQHFREIADKLVQHGWPQKKAEQYAAIRIFDEAPGRYDLNVSRIVSASGTWENDSVVADEYLKRMSYGYGNGLWGEPMEEVYKMVLSGTKMVIHSRSTNLYGTLDNDDFFMYAGGLSAAVRELDGKTPELAVTNMMNPAKPEMTPIDKMIGMELRSRYLNPQWIEGMKKEGFEGANKMAEIVENMWGWQVTVPESMDAARWEQMFEVYVTDKYGMDLEEFFKEKNPYAYQSITARMLETVRKGYWQPAEEILQTLAKDYAETVAEYGAACCEHTCNNPAFQQYTMDILNVPGLVSSDTLNKYTEVLQAVSVKSLNERKSEMDKVVHAQTISSGKGERQTAPARANEQMADDKDFEKTEVVKGLEMEEIKASESKVNLHQSNKLQVVIAVTLGCIGFFVYGWARKRF
ncbi:MAG: cobaltochelatase subunit CobN [Candidatus Brocadia sp.]|nr:cobaltochelatase subunit CobN [Candidatus Brocadia sp.]